MNAKDFFYLEHFDKHFTANFLKTLIGKKILKSYHQENELHYYEIGFEINDDFIYKNFQTYLMDDITLLALSKACIQNAITAQPLADIINEVRVKSNYYPILHEPKLSLNEMREMSRIIIYYKVTLILVPDHLNF